MLLAVTLLSTIGYVQIRRAYDQVDQALGKARRSEANAVAAARQAEQERQRTQKEYERADANLTVALAALDEISDKLASRPLPQSVRLGTDEASSLQAIGGLSDADAEIVQSLLQFYDQFAAKNAAGSVVDFATARVHRRIGDIRARLGQYDQAVSAFRQALDTVGELRDAQPADMALLRFEVQTHNALGTALLKSGDFQRAIETHRQAQELLAAGPPSVGNQRDLRYEQALTLEALVLTRSAAFLDQQNRRGPRRPGQDAPPTAPPEIQAEFQQAVQLLDGLLQDAPENADYLLALARCHRSVLPVAWANADQQAAATAKQQAIGILQRLADQKPDDLTIQFELADTLAMTAQADARQPLPDSDVAVLERSLQLATDLHEKCPTAPEYAILQANVHQRLGVHFLAAKQWSDCPGPPDEGRRRTRTSCCVVPDQPLVPVLAGTRALGIGGQLTAPRVIRASRDSCWRKPSPNTASFAAPSPAVEPPSACSSACTGNSPAFWNNSARSNWRPKPRGLRIGSAIRHVERQPRLFQAFVNGSGEMAAADLRLVVSPTATMRIALRLRSRQSRACRSRLRSSAGQRIRRRMPVLSEKIRRGFIGMELILNARWLDAPT